jgi:hypothetical protein
MPADMHIYLGAYAETTTRLEQRVVDACRQPDECPKDQTSPFCPRCGLSASARFRTITARERCVDLATMTNEQLTFGSPAREGDGFVLYTIIPNVKRPGCAYRSFYSSDRDLVLDLTGIDPQADIAAFRDAFAEELRVVEQEYGNIEVRWGLVTDSEG